MATAFARVRSDPATQADVVAALNEGRCFPYAAPVRRIDTHAASVFLVGDRAWKLKREVRYGYLDFSTADKRKSALDAELRLNRRTAPGIYVAVHPITISEHGEIKIDGGGECIDWILEMRRFPDGAVLTDMADHGSLDSGLLSALTDRIVAFHSAAPVSQYTSGAAPLRRIVQSNQAAMLAVPEIFAPCMTRTLHARQRGEINMHSTLLDNRARAGRVRHVHGDMHLGNIAMIDGEPTLFDCLEFNEEFATIDVLYDLAFLMMDLWARNLRTEATVVFNRYLDLSESDETGVALMPLFLSLRATVTAHVLAAKYVRLGREHLNMRRSAEAHFILASGLLNDVSPSLVAIGGLSGTGKSSLAKALGGHIGRAPGARIVRSDVIRKRTYGVKLETQLAQSHYTPKINAEVYSELVRVVGGVLQQGSAAISDAVFAKESERSSIEHVAREYRAAFDGIWLETVTAKRLARVTSRKMDASDADAAVVNTQANLAVGKLDGWHTLRADAPLADVSSAAHILLGLDLCATDTRNIAERV